MTWVILAAGTAVFYALHGAWSKETAARVGSLLGAWSLFLFSLPLFVLYLAATGVPDLGPRFWPALITTSLVNTASIYLFFSALRDGELGVTYPLLALSPLFMVPVEWVLLGELPGPWGGVGIILMVLGIYLLNFDSRVARDLIGPFRALGASPGARKAMAVAVLWAVAGTVDRVAVLDSSPAFYGVALSAALSCTFLPLFFLTRWKGENGDSTGRGSVPLMTALGAAGPLWLAIHGLLFAAMFVLQMEALRLALASYVLSIKRAGSLLAVVLGWAAFRERALAPRLLGSAITVFGATVLVVWG